MAATTQPFARRADAVALLTAKGMKFNYDDRSQKREYWWFDNGRDALLDHSATITKLGRTFYVSCFDPREA